MSEAHQTENHDEEITRPLADHAMSLSFDDLPQNTVEVAKHCILDWLGVTIAGRPEPLTEILIDHALAEGSAPQATLIGDGRKVSVTQAALINGSASHALDFDDVQQRFHGHPTAPVAPVLLALAENSGANGRDVIAALVAGVEVECRINVFMGDSHYEEGWHSTATNGTFGAAVGASHLFSFDGEQCALAMGVAGTQAAGLRSMFGTMCKPLHAGKAAQNGLFAAQLVGRGFTSRPDVLERPLGFGDTQSQGTNITAALDDLGTRYEINSVLFKYHAACHGVHATIDALQAIAANQSVDTQDVEHVDVAVQSEYMNICGIDRPETGLEGKFSLRFCAALALAGEDTASTDTYSDSSVKSPRLVELTNKTKITAKPDMPMKVADVAVRMRDGVVHRLRGNVGIPAEDLEAQWTKLVAKFRSCAVPVIGSSKAERVIDIVQGLERADNIHDLMQACSP